MTTTTTKKQETAEAIEKLRKLIPPGSIVYTTLRHCARSGMQRAIDAHVIVDGQPYWVGRLVAAATGHRYDDRHQGIVVRGAGMDMGFHLIYCLSYALYPKGFACIGEGCPSTDHSNRIDATHHTEGGYAIRHSWL